MALSHFVDSTLRFHLHFIACGSRFLRMGWNVRRLVALASSAIAIMCSATQAIAHPHVWINWTSVAQMRGTTLVAIQETWSFAEGFPVSIVGDIADIPKSGPLDAKHTAMFKQQAFDSLRNTGYFTHVFANGKALNMGTARDFSVAIENGHVVYHFVAPLVTPVDITRRDVRIGVWDESFFVDFQKAQATPLSFSTPSASDCHVSAFEDHDHAIFGGAIFPEAYKLSC